LIDENRCLKERIDEYATNEKRLIEINEDLQRQVRELTTKVDHVKEIEQRRLDYDSLYEKYEYEKQELQTIIEQLREDIVDLNKTKQLPIGELFLLLFLFSQNQFSFLLDTLHVKSHTSKRNDETTISQYEECRLKLETSLQKISKQRDAYKMDLRLTKQMLTSKENEYQEKIALIENEKSQLEHRLQQANHALDLADSHLKQEIEKIKTNLEQKYKRRYEHDLKQLRQQLTAELDMQNKPIATSQSKLELE